MTPRETLETEAVRLLVEWAGRQLSMPKNRAKGVPTETPERLVRMAQCELDEALHAMRAKLPMRAVLAELGDAGAFVALAMWRAVAK